MKTNPVTNRAYLVLFDWISFPFCSDRAESNQLQLIFHFAFFFWPVYPSFPGRDASFPKLLDRNVLHAIHPYSCLYSALLEPSALPAPSTVPDRPWAKQTGSDAYRHTDPRTSHEQYVACRGQKPGCQQTEASKLTWSCSWPIAAPWANWPLQVLIQQYFVQPLRLENLPEPSLLDHRGSKWQGNI